MNRLPLYEQAASRRGALPSPRTGDFGDMSASTQPSQRSKAAMAVWNPKQEQVRSICGTTALPSISGFLRDHRKFDPVGKLYILLLNSVMVRRESFRDVGIPVSYQAAVSPCPTITSCHDFTQPPKLFPRPGPSHQPDCIAKQAGLSVKQRSSSQNSSSIRPSCSARLVADRPRSLSKSICRKQ